MRDLHVDLFGTFVETIGSLPAEAIIRMLERERKTIENDILRERPFSEADEFSIFNFCLLVRAMTLGSEIFPVFMPENHVEFYRRIIAKLIRAGEFSHDALQKFDEAVTLKNIELPLVA